MKSSRENSFAWDLLNSEQKIYIRSCGDFTLVPPDTEQFRTVNFGEIFWPVSGRCAFWLGNVKYILKPGEVWYYPPGSFHEYRPVTVFHYCWLAIAGQNAGKLFDALGISPGLNKAGTCPLQLFSLLEHDFMPQNIYNRISAMSTAFRILLHLSYPGLSSLKSSSTMDDVKTLIDTSYSIPGLNASCIAAKLGMHLSSFSRAFHRRFKTTVTEYITGVRLERASFMLKKTTLPIKEIAESCGFSSANYFAKVFLARYGTSPQKYRAGGTHTSRSSI